MLYFQQKYERGETFSGEIWTNVKYFKVNSEKGKIFSGKIWKRRSIFRWHVKDEKYFQVKCEKGEIPWRPWVWRRKMVSKPRERTILVWIEGGCISSWTLGFTKTSPPEHWWTLETLVNITKTLQNIDLTSSRRKTTFLQELVFLKQMWPMKYRLAAFYAAGSELGRLYQYIGSLEN